MQATVVRTRPGTRAIRSLRNGDTATAQAVFDQLGEESRRLRFGKATPRLALKELSELARVGGLHHVLVGTIGGVPVGIARLVRDAEKRHLADVAYAVADDWQRRGIGTALMRALISDAAVAGITHVRADIRLENDASLSLLKKATNIVSRRVVGGEIAVVALTT